MDEFQYKWTALIQCIKSFTLHFTFTHSHAHPYTGAHQRHFEIKYLAQRHIDMWTGRAANQTAELLISG